MAQSKSAMTEQIIFVCAESSGSSHDGIRSLGGISPEQGRKYSEKRREFSVLFFSSWVPRFVLTAPPSNFPSENLGR